MKKLFSTIATVSAAMCFAPLAVANVPFSESAIPAAWSDITTASRLDDIESSDFVTPLAFKETGPHGSCRLVVWDAGWDSVTNWLGVQGGRENCANAVGFKVSLKKDEKLRPDPVLGSTKGYHNGIIRAFGACQGPGNYYGEVVSDTGLILRGDNVGACR